jgi:hypothetical protein
VLKYYIHKCAYVDLCINERCKPFSATLNINARNTEAAYVPHLLGKIKTISCSIRLRFTVVNVACTHEYPDITNASDFARVIFCNPIQKFKVANVQNCPGPILSYFYQFSFLTVSVLCVRHYSSPFSPIHCSLPPSLYAL